MLSLSHTDKNLRVPQQSFCWNQGYVSQRKEKRCDYKAQLAESMIEAFQILDLRFWILEFQSKIQNRSVSGLGNANCAHINIPIEQHPRLEQNSKQEQDGLKFTWSFAALPLPRTTE